MSYTRASKIMSWIDKRISKLQQFQNKFTKTETSTKVKSLDIPDGLFTQCYQCQTIIYNKDLSNNMYVCQYYDYHFRVKAKNRLLYTIDEGSFKEINDNLVSLNILKMPQYENKLIAGQKMSKLNEAFISGEATINNIPVAIGVLDSFFMMGSMGSVVGEKITRLIEYACDHNLPLIIFTASGGARMQEGIFSLMQ